MGNRFKRRIASLEPNQGPATILYVAQRSSIWAAPPLFLLQLTVFFYKQKKSYGFSSCWNFKYSIWFFQVHKLMNSWKLLI